MHIETDRMFIRPFTMDDLSDLQEILGDDETMACCEPAYTLEKTRDFLQRFCIAKNGAVAAALKETGKVIGYILFHELEAGVYEAGWIFHKAHRRKGFAYEACGAVIEYAFSHMGIHKVFAETIDLTRSVPLMVKLGMKPEGIQRSQVRDSAGGWADLHLYGLLAQDRQ